MVSYSKSTNLKLTAAVVNDFVAETLDLMLEEFETHETSVKQEFGEDTLTALMSKNELQQVILEPAVQRLTGNVRQGHLDDS